MKPAEKVLQLAKKAGLVDDWDGSRFCDRRGDWSCLTILDVASGVRAAKQYLAANNLVGLVQANRRRVYGSSSRYRISERKDVFLVGQNENNNPYLHQVSSRITTLDEAWKWIWRGKHISLRQGDIGLVPIGLHPKNRGEDLDVAVVSHSRHKFIGEVRWGHFGRSLAVRGGFLYHEGGQHPTLPVPADKWYQVVVGRRSERAKSTRD